MAYTINKTNGAVLATVADGTIDNSTDVTLIGKNYSGYGEILNENFVKLMENFASTSSPASPLAGQLWWDLSNNSLKVYTGSGFKVISGSTASATQPSNATLGDLWFDTVNSQLRVYNGTSWTLIGPSFTAGTGVSGAVITTVLDNTGASHVVVQFFVNEAIVAIMSKDSTFTPQTSIPGFSTISPGIQVSSAVVGAGFTGTASNADLLDNLNSTQFMRSDANTTTTGTLRVQNDAGLYVGSDSDLNINVAGSDVVVYNTQSNGDIFFRVNRSTGGQTTALTIDGATGYVYATTPNAGDNSTRLATTAYVDGISTEPGSGFLKADGSTPLAGNLIPDVHNTRTLGSPALRYAEVYATNLIGKAVEAQYADLAERFEADSAYEPGTVVELGGDKEITAVADELSDKVFGVISTNPGFLMNNKVGDDSTHPAIAMTGRVPVKVTGKVSRGDRLVSAGNGLARAAKPGEATSFNVIGRALENKTTTGISTVNAVVKIQ
jgi:hypothetical protein